MVLTDSSRARSMNAQVLTTRQSAASGAAAISWPASVSIPSISSEPTWFLGHPSVVKWTFLAGRIRPPATPAPPTDPLPTEDAPATTPREPPGVIRYPAPAHSRPDDHAQRPPPCARPPRRPR